jgi:signal transduction histidine kinase
LVTPKGLVTVDYVANPLKKEGRIVGCRVIIRDISDKKEMEKKLADYSLHLEEMVKAQTEDLRKSEAQLQSYALHLEELVEEKTKKLLDFKRMAAIGELAAIVGHDLRNPLQAITNAVCYLKKSISVDADCRTREVLEAINKAVKYSDKIVLDLLDYSRQIKLDLAPTLPREVVDASLSMVEIPSNIKVFNFVRSEPTITVDFDKIRRALVNVIKNAVDAQPEGGSITLQSQKRKGNIEFIISDKGPGMPQEILEKLGTPIATTKAKGMGFGIAICKRMVEAHGGTISANSTIGQGTVFRLSIPIAGVVQQSQVSCLVEDKKILLSA